MGTASVVKSEERERHARTSTCQDDKRGASEASESWRTTTGSRTWLILEFGATVRLLYDLEVGRLAASKAT